MTSLRSFALGVLQLLLWSTLFGIVGTVIHLTPSIPASIAQSKPPPQIVESSGMSTDQFVAKMVETMIEDRITTDAKGMILFATPSAAKMFGYTPPELKNKPSTMLIPERYRKFHLQGLAERMDRANRGLPNPLTGLSEEDTVTPKVCEGLLKDGTEKKFQLLLRISRAGKTFLFNVTVTPYEALAAQVDEEEVYIASLERESE